MPESFALEELFHFGRKRGELCWQLDRLCDSSRVVADHFLSRLGLRNRVLTLDYLGQRDYVISFIEKCLCSRIILAHGKNHSLKTHHVEISNLVSQTLLAHERGGQGWQADVEFATTLNRHDGNDPKLVLAEFKGV